jgi:hypothetical protein
VIVMFQFRIGTYSSRVNKYVLSINSAVSSLIPEKSKHYMETDLYQVLK